MGLCDLGLPRNSPLLLEAYVPVCVAAYECSLKDVVFEPQANKFLISASSDATFSLWQ